MEQLVEREESIRKYLLGELAEEEQTEVQILLLTDEEYFNELLLVEGELTDEFVFGTLSDHEQERIRDHFLSVPMRQDELRFTKALERYVSESEAMGSPGITWENTLAEAQENRYLLSSLVDDDWMGLRLLALLRPSQYDKSELIEKLNVHDSVITGVLIRLLECGVIEERDGLFFATNSGLEALFKIENAAGMSLD